MIMLTVSDFMWDLFFRNKCIIYIFIYISIFFGLLDIQFYFLVLNCQDEKKSEGPDPIYKRRRKFCSYLEEVCC